MDPRDELREACAKAGISRHKLTELAGLNKNALYLMDDPDWNPTADTITKLWKAVKAASASRPREGTAA